MISQLAEAVLGRHSVLYVFFQVATAGILVLAANTAFNGFPVLASILAQHRFLPRQLHTRGDRLVFSNGILLLGRGFAIALVVGFDANIDQLIQLYIIGVFTSFTLSQAGMVKHWNRSLLPSGDTDGAARRIARSRADQHARRRRHRRGAGHRALHEGRARRVDRDPRRCSLLFVMMRGIRRHYDPVADELQAGRRRTADAALAQPRRRPGLASCTCRRCARWPTPGRPGRSTLDAVTVGLDPEEADGSAGGVAAHEASRCRWWCSTRRTARSPGRCSTTSATCAGERPRDVVTVFIPEYVVGRWWEQLLHNQSALRLKARLLFEPGVMVTSVPWQLHSSEGKDPAEPLG